MLKKRNLLIVGAVLVAIAIFAAFRMGRNNAPRYFTARVERGDIRQVVEATGTINAVITVQVGSQVSGTISKLHADFNSRVKKGQVIAEIDPSIFQGQVLQAQADLENARANLAAARANLERMRSTAVQAKAEYERTQQLAKEGVMSQQQLEVVRASHESAVAQVSAAQAAVTQAQAQVAQRSAALQVAQTNLSHTIIRAPIDGVVVARSVDIGQTVAASLQAPTLFTIAQDLTKMQVYAKTDESDVGQIRPGQQVTFKVDAFPNETFRGAVMQVRMNPTTVQNVVTYDTVIEFSNPEMKLFPGMTAYVTIPVAAARDVLKLPNGALRFKPDMSPEEIRALYQKHGVEMPRGREEREEGGEGRQAAAAEAGGAPAAGNGGQPGGGRRGPRAEAPGGGMEGAGPMPRRERRTDMTVVWKLLPDKSIQPIKVRTGITDRTVTELVQALQGGELKEGDELVTGSQSAGRAGGPPGMPGGRPGGGGPGRR